MPREVTQVASADRAAPLVAVIAVNWNGWRDTLQGFEHLKLSTYPNWRLIVVDNASSDDSVEKIRNAGADIHLVVSDANLGFAGGCNLGVEAAREMGADYLYFLNNDAFVEPTTIERLLAASRALDDCAVLGSVIRFQGDGTLQFWGSRHDHSWGGPDWFSPNEQLFSRAAPLIESDFIMGASLLAPMAMVEKVGPFDERFFLNFEETDWCYRARTLGYRCVVVKDALVRHRGGASIGHSAGPMQMYFMRRNRLLFCERNCSLPLFATVYLRQAVGAILRIIVSALKPRDRARAIYSRVNLLATLHYTSRRFGSCPPVVHKMAAEFRSIK